MVTTAVHGASPVWKCWWRFRHPRRRLGGNAGAHGGDIGQWTVRATVVAATGEVYDREQEELEFGYRQSNLDDW